jgi:hypothetical protein
MCQAVAIALNEAHKWGDNPEEEELVDLLAFIKAGVLPRRRG